MSSDSPKFSVVIPLYNKAAYVAQAISSALGQTVLPHEIIIIDDGSTDNGAGVVAAFAHPLVKLIQQPNAGVAAARNSGITACTGDFIAFLDADDRYLPHFLATISRLIREYPSADIFCTFYRKFSATGRHISNEQPRLKLRERGLVNDFYAHWGRSPFFCSDSIAVRRAAFIESAVRFPIGERLGEDQDTWFRLAERYALAFDPATACEYRVDVPASATQCLTVIDILPCYQRLAERLQLKTVPNKMVKSARRLLASHYLNVARARLAIGDRDGVYQLLSHPFARCNLPYLFRTLLWYVASFGGIEVRR